MSFDAKGYVQALENAIRSNPATAPRACAVASKRMFAESMKSENGRVKLHLQALAARLNTMSAAQAMPVVGPESGEIAGVYADAGPALVTEYDAMIVDLETSKAGGANGDLAAAQVFQQLQDARADDVAPPVRITPASARAGKTIFGNSALIQFGGAHPTGTPGQFGSQPVAYSEAMLVRWDGEENESMITSIAVGVIPQGAGGTFPTAKNPAATPYSYRPYLRVRFGASRAQPMDLTADVAAGTSFTVPASSFLDLSAGMDAPQAGYVAGSQVVGATFGFFGANKTTSLQRTAYIDALAATGTQNILIPAFAASIMPGGLQMTDPNGVLGLDFKDANGAIIYHLDMLVPGSQVAAIPLSNDVYSIDVKNNGGITSTIRVMFALSV